MIHDMTSVGRRPGRRSPRWPGTALAALIMSAVTHQAASAEITSTIDRIDDVSGWSVNADGGEPITFRRETADVHSAPAAMRVSFGGQRWGNLRHAATVPPDATAVTFWVKIHRASIQSGMYVWLFERDGDGYCARVMLEGRVPADWPDGWIRMRVPLGQFRYDPRGNGKRDLLSVDRILVGFNYGPIEASIDDVAWERHEGVGRAPVPRSQSFQVGQGRLGRVAILDEPTLAPPQGRSAATRLGDVLRAAGFGVTFLRAGDLGDAERLKRSNFDLLVMLQGARFPLDARRAVLTFLKAGGALLTAGGYAFDEPVVFTGKAWKPAGTVETANEIQAGKATVSRINTRFGRPGDAMGFSKTQIGMFDPSYQYERVARAEIADRRIDGPLTGWVACVVDPTGSPVYGKAHLRFVPLGWTFDRLGRSRGPLGGLAHHFAGPYAGSSWAFFGVENRDLFAENGLPTDFIVRLARRLVDQVYLHRLTTDLACYRDGETVNVTVHLANRGRTTASGRLRILVEDEAIHDQTVRFTPDKGQSTSVTASWHPAQFERDYYRVRATLELSYHTDTIESAFCAWKPAVIARGREIRLRENTFRINGRPTFLTGTNQTGRMWLSEYEDPRVWRDDFAGMRDHGMVLWRILHFSPVMHRTDPLALRGEIPKEIIRETDAVVQLAQKYGVVVFLTLHDWMPVELTDEQLAAQAKWNAFWADRYKDVPGMMYDVQNEPCVRISEAPHVVSQWKQMLTERYGSVDAAAKRWGVSTGNASVSKPQATGKVWTDLKAIDVERFRVRLLNRWIRANVEPVRRADPDALVTVGFLQRLRPADKVLGARHVDFANMHSYLPLRAFPSDFKLLDRRAVGKSLTLGEFGQREAHDARTHGLTGDRPTASIRRYMAYNHDVLGLGGSFTASWCWRDMPDCVFPWGMCRPDHLPKPVLRAYRNFTLMSRFMKPKYRPPVVWLVLPDAHRLGGKWSQIQAAIDRTIDALLGLRVELGVLREQDVVGGVLAKPVNAVDGASSPHNPVLIWPMPYCPDDATFAAIKRCVEGGGALYLSGDVSFDETRRPTRSARLAALGLTLDAHRSPFDAKATGPLQQTRVGKGRVFFVPYPVELGRSEDVRAQLDAFLTDAGAPRIPTEPTDPDLHAFATYTVDGGRVYNVVNHGKPRSVGLKVRPEPLTIDVAAPGYGLTMLGGDGRLTALQTQGTLRRGDDAIVQAKGDVILVALDGVDVTGSGRLLVMPNAVGEVVIKTGRTWREPVATVGEVAGGRFCALETVALPRGEPRMKLEIDPDRALTLILITERQDASATGELVAKTLTLPNE